MGLFLNFAMAATISCASAPYGLPSNPNNSLQLCHPGYYTQYNTEEYDPEIVIWKVDSNSAIGCGDRNGNFHHDLMANGKDAPPSDYIGSNYDKGHLADAKDFTFDDKMEVDTFSMTNMTPQVPGLNRGGWKWLETSTRYYAIKDKEVIVFAGPVFSKNDGKLNSQVDIPKYFWKVIYSPSSNTAISVLVPNDSINGKDILNYIVSVNKIQSEIGITIPLPSKYNKDEIANKNDWMPVFKDLTKASKEKCQKE